MYFIFLFVEVAQIITAGIKLRHWVARYRCSRYFDPPRYCTSTVSSKFQISGVAVHVRRGSFYFEAILPYLDKLCYS